jgi:CheY-like chemotaxis protein
MCHAGADNAPLARSFAFANVTACRTRKSRKRGFFVAQILLLPRAAVRVPAAGQMTRILVVDDDEAVRSAFSVALASLPYELHEAGGCYEALTFLAEKRVDLIFLDLHMPEASGIEALRAIRSEDRVTPIFIVTAFAEEFMTDLRRAAAEGLHFNLLRKPLGIDEIRAAASAALGLWERREEEAVHGRDEVVRDR